MTKKCYICNKYFIDAMDLIQHTKERHKTHSFTAMIEYYEAKLKRTFSFLNKDISYLESFDLEDIINRLIKAEVEIEFIKKEDIAVLKQNQDLVSMNAEPIIACSSDKDVPPDIVELRHELNGIKELIFNANFGSSELPLVPMGPGSEKQMKDRLLWLTHGDKRTGAKMIKTGYKDFHTELMDELSPKLEKIFWELE